MRPVARPARGGESLQGCDLSSRKFFAGSAAWRTGPLFWGVIALWVALLAGFLGRLGWPLDLFVHFPLQYVALFLASALVLSLRQRFMQALIAVAGALLAGLPLAQHLGMSPMAAQAVNSSGGPSSASPTVEQPYSATFRLVTYNAWLRHREHTPLAEYLEGVKADAIVLQEISTAQAEALREMLPSYPYAYTQPGLKGAVVFARWPILDARTVTLGEGGTPAASVALNWRDTRVNLLGVHLHWPLGGRRARLRNQELREVAAYARSASGPTLIAGDFNTTQWSGHFKDMIRDSGLSVCARGHAIALSWPAQFIPLGISIDHCLSSDHWRSLEIRTGPRLGSDHLALVVDLHLDR